VEDGTLSRFFWSEWFRGWRGALLATAALACAPAPKTVGNISGGIIGCPEEQLAVFNYDRAKRTWNAACLDRQYVCSDGRGGARCTPQAPETIDEETAVRAKAMLEVAASKRRWFVNKDISQGNWREFAVLISTLRVMTDEQLSDVDPRQVFTKTSKAFDDALRACVFDTGQLAAIVNPSGGDFEVPQGLSDVICRKELLSNAELAPLRSKPPGTKSYLLPGVFAVEPIARPTFASPAAPVASAAPTQPVPEAGSSQASSATAPAGAPAELEAAVRAWLDQERDAILDCTGKPRSMVLVEINEGKAQVTVRGLDPASPESRCVQNALGKPPQLPPGSGTILHAVKAAQ
jgi:hypothetical protein